MTCLHGSMASNNFCPDCGKKNRIKTGKFPKLVDIYVHGSKESNWEKGEQIGLSEGAIKENFQYAAYELKLTYKVQEDGTHELLSVDDKEFKV